MKTEEECKELLAFLRDYEAKMLQGGLLGQESWFLAGATSLLDWATDEPGAGDVPEVLATLIRNLKMKPVADLGTPS